MTAIFKAFSGCFPLSKIGKPFVGRQIQKPSVCPKRLTTGSSTGQLGLHEKVSAGRNILPHSRPSSLCRKHRPQMQQIQAKIWIFTFHYGDSTFANARHLSSSKSVIPPKAWHTITDGSMARLCESIPLEESFFGYLIIFTSAHKEIPPILCHPSGHYRQCGVLQY